MDVSFTEDYSDEEVPVYVMEEEEEEVSPTPMDNHLILSKLFELCPVPCLAKFRQVCKHWHNLSLLAWRSQVYITLGESIFYNNYGEFWGEVPEMDRRPPYLHPTSKMTNMEKFLDFVEDPQNEYSVKPYCNFKLKDWDFREHKELVEKFWEACGPYITFLELSSCTFHDVNDFSNVVYKRCPKLKRLNIKEYRVINYQFPIIESIYKPPKHGENKVLKTLCVDMDYRPLPVSWMELLSHFPSLTELTIFNARVPDSLKDILHAIYLIKSKHPSKLCIKNLDLLSASMYAQETFPNEVWSLLKSLKFPLESLTIDFGIETKLDLVKDILTMYAPTLRKLDAYRGLISDPYSNFPFGVQLDSLTEIYMSDRLCSDLEFLKFTPNLKKFNLIYAISNQDPYIYTSIVDDTNKEAMVDVRMEKLVELNVGYVMNEQDLSYLVTWFPNLEKLQMKLTDKQFAIVCEHCNKLTYLEVFGYKLTDKGVTGRESSTSEVTHANITNLKSLRTFIMMGEELVPTKLGDASGLDGFLPMDSLQTLRINAQMNENVRISLMKKIPDCEITFYMPTNIVDDFTDDDDDWNI